MEGSNHLQLVSLSGSAVAAPERMFGSEIEHYARRGGQLKIIANIEQP